jgi:hypothetical protein
VRCRFNPAILLPCGLSFAVAPVEAFAETARE